jgi:hypothetical protein
MKKPRLESVPTPEGCDDEFSYFLLDGRKCVYFTEWAICPNKLVKTSHPVTWAANSENEVATEDEEILKQVRAIHRLTHN